MTRKSLFIHLYNQPRWVRIYKELVASVQESDMELHDFDATRFRFPSASSPINARNNLDQTSDSSGAESSFQWDNRWFESEMLTYFSTTQPTSLFARYYLRKSKQRALKFANLLSAVLSKHSYDTIYIPNGRLGLAQIAAEIAKNRQIQICYLETNLPGYFSTIIPPRFFIGNFPVHERIAVQQATCEIDTSEYNDRAVFDDWLLPRMIPSSDRNTFSRRWSSEEGIKSEGQNTQKRLNIFLTSSTDEFWALGPDWADHDWMDQYEAFDACIQTLRSNDEDSFVLRIHPNLINKSLPFVVRELKRIRWIRTRHPELEIVGPLSTKNTYSLILKSKRVFVSVSTIGLEASGLGVPVWCTMPNNYDLNTDVRRVHSKKLVTKKHLEIPRKVNIKKAHRHVTASLLLGRKYILESPVITNVPLANQLRAIGTRDVLFRLLHITNSRFQILANKALLKLHKF